MSDTGNIKQHDAEKAYLEHFAKELLETLLPDKYSQISHSERPDLLMGPDYGIEVTWAMFENQGRGRGILNIASGKKLEQLSKGIRRNIEKANIEMITKDNGIICGYEHKEYRNRCTDDELIQEYQKKKEKIAGYSTKITDLFIFPALAQIDNWLGEDVICEYFKTISDDENNPFNNIIVYEEPTLYVLNIPKKQYISIRGQEEQIKKCYMAADSYSGYSEINRIRNR